MLSVTLAGVPLSHCPRNGHGVVAERLEDHRPFELPLATPLCCLLLRGDLLGGQCDRLWQVSLRNIIRHRKLRFACNHSEPWGGAATSLQSCGLTRFGRPGEWLGSLFVEDLAITA